MSEQALTLEQLPGYLDQGNEASLLFQKPPAFCRTGWGSVIFSSYRLILIPFAGKEVACAPDFHDEHRTTTSSFSRLTRYKRDV